MESTGTIEDAVTVVDPVANEAVHEHENQFLCERVASARNLRSWKKQERQLRDVISHQQLTVKVEPEVPDVCIGH